MTFNLIENGEENNNSGDSGGGRRHGGVGVVVVGCSRVGGAIQGLEVGD